MKLGHVDNEFLTGVEIGRSCPLHPEGWIRVMWSDGRSFWHPERFVYVKIDG